MKKTMKNRSVNHPGYCGFTHMKPQVHFAFKPKAAKARRSIGGSSAYIRKAIAAGHDPKEVRAVVIQRWPKFATKAEKPYLTKRIQIAKRVAAHHVSDN